MLAAVSNPAEADVIVVGAGLAGLVATAELADAGRKVILLDQEPEASLGGQAFWSFGGLFFVNSPEQRRMGISDSQDLAWQDRRVRPPRGRVAAPMGGGLRRLCGK
jgi:predicted oxidoreductase